MLNNLEKHFESAAKGPVEAPPTGTRKEQAEELLRRCRERDRRLEETALACERDGDTDGTWLAMAARAENKRFIEQLERDLTEL